MPTPDGTLQALCDRFPGLDAALTAPDPATSKAMHERAVTEANLYLKSKVADGIFIPALVWGTIAAALDLAGAYYGPRESKTATEALCNLVRRIMP